MDRTIPSLPSVVNLTTLEQKQDVFRKILVQEFFREFNFLSDVVMGRAQAKGDFTDKLVKMLTISVGAIIDAAAFEGGGAVSAILETGIDAANDERKSKRAEHIGHLCDEVDPEKLKILLIQIANFAAQRHAQFIDKFLSENPAEAIIPFAKAAVERMLEYIARCNLELSVENLLQGLIQGRSGAYITGFTNTELACKLEDQQDYTAEGAYARAGFRKQENQQWQLYHLSENERIAKKDSSPHIDKQILKQKWEQVAKDTKIKDTDKPKTKIKKGLARVYRDSKTLGGWLVGIGQKELEHIQNVHSHYGYSHLNNLGLPKYGYADVAEKVITLYEYKKVNTVNSFAEASECPQICNATVDNVKDYMQAVAEARKKNVAVLSFREFIKQIYHYPTSYSATALAVYIPDLSTLADKNLSYGDFTGVFFQALDLTDFNLQHACFEKAFLWHCNLTNANATQTNFSEAHLEYVIAKQANFTAANLNHAQLQFANLEAADLTNITERGVNWIGTELKDIKDRAIEELSISTLQKVENRILQIKQHQEKESKLVREQLRKEMDGINNELKQFAESVNKCEEEQTEFQKELIALRQQQQILDAFKRFAEQEIQQLQQDAKETQQDNAKQITALQKQINTNQKIFGNCYKEFAEQFNNELKILKNQLKIHEEQLQKLTKDTADNKEQLNRLEEEIAMKQTETPSSLKQTLFGGNARVKKASIDVINMGGVHVKGKDLQKAAEAANEIREREGLFKKPENPQQVEQSVATDNAQIDDFQSKVLNQNAPFLEEAQTQTDKEKELQKLLTEEQRNSLT